jgi:hypothetical protein
VGGAWTARDEADARPTGQFAIRLCHVGGARLVPAHDHPDHVLNIVQRIEHCQEALARNAKSRIDAMGHQAVDEEPAGALACEIPLL